MGRKRAKEQLKNKGGDEGSYKNAIRQLFIEKEEMKLKDLRWQESKTIHERKISVEEKRLICEQEQKIMLYDVNSLVVVDQNNCVLPVRAQIMAPKMAEFSEILGGYSGGSCVVGDNGLDGDASI